jgi:hypothetical protein
MKQLFFLLCLSCSTHAYAQQKSFIINGISFITTKHTEKNDYETKDYYINLYKIVKGKKQFFLKFYTYQFAVDCNNVFKDIGKIEIKKDSLILKTHYTQKGHDPIPEWEKTIYIIETSGKIKFISTKTYKDGFWQATL